LTIIIRIISNNYTKQEEPLLIVKASMD